MNTIFSLFAASLLFFSFHHHVSKENDSIASIDTTCSSEINKAKEDILNGKLTYCHYFGMFSRPFRNEKEMIALLKQFNISYKPEIISDVITDQNEGCYCAFMTEKIKDLFGIHFIDSLENKADSIYLTQHINDTIPYTNCDTWARYPGTADNSEREQCSVLQRQFDAHFKYPTGYKISDDNETSAFVDVSFLINKAGQAQIIGYDFLFDIEENHLYEEYFKRNIDKLVKKTGWMPAKIRRQKVVSDCVLRIFLQ